MRFTEERTAFDPYSKVTVRDEQTGNEISVIPEMGARLNHFQVSLHGSSFEIIDGYLDAETLSGEAYSKSSLLAPFPNRVADGKYEWQREVQQLEINKPDENNAIHGFISDQVFELVSSGPEGDYYEMVLVHESEGAMGYPFSFFVTVTYRFGGEWVSVETKIANTSKGDIPVGFGWHPYLRMSATVETLQLMLPEVEKLEVDERLIPTGQKTTFSEFENFKPIAGTEFDTGFQLIGERREVQLFNDATGMTVTLSLSGENNNYDYLQVFIPPGRESIALEPMTCAADAFNNEMGLRTLAPDESLKARFMILVS